MNIALYHNLPSGGARRAMVEMVRGLAARGHSIDEYCPETADQSFLPLNGIVRRTTVLPFEARGVAKDRVPLLTPYITTVRLISDLRAMAAVGEEAARRIDQQGYDVAFTHDCQLTLVPDVLRFLHLPSIHYFHVGGRGLEEIKRGYSKPKTVLSAKIKTAYYAPAHRIYPCLRFRQAKRNLRAVGRVLTNSRFAAAELYNAFHVTAEVCILGVDITVFRPLGLSRERFVLSVGAVHPYKGYRFLLQSLAKLSQDKRPTLIIAANSAEPDELRTLQALAAELNVALNVHNVADAAEMASLYNRAAAFVYAPIREPWGLAAIEAMACGTPVVAVGEGGVAESVEDGRTGLLTKRDPHEFATALGRILTDPALAACLGTGGVTNARNNFTWGSTVDSIERHLYEAAKIGASS
ncbi:MAG: glycosyltransferase family 4 protein [Caldilineaceae bacterium]|nr:glycosyltransferase family 4 protein [Caldilineaceae bacterium]